MIVCGLVQNFSFDCLHIRLYTCDSALSTVLVDIYFLIFNQISILSTKLNSGANLISLYFFLAKISGKLSDKAVFFLFYSRRIFRQL